MAEAAVDATPLITLARAGLFDLLRLAGEPIVVPAAVAAELERRGRDDAAVVALRDAEWLSVVAAAPIPLVLVRLGLGTGETAVMAWALAHPGCVAVIDDLTARRRADAFGILVRGTLSLIIEAKRRGLIERVAPAIERVRRVGFHVSDRLVEDILRRAGEQPQRPSTT
jgi:predicted nucleic acid-binding protein